MKKSSFLLAIFVFALLLTTGCADVETLDQCTIGHTYGFWGGLWHGIITPFSFIGSFFSNDIAVYAVNNNGGWYDFGFLLGVGGLGFGGASASKSRR